MVKMDINEIVDTETYPINKQEREEQLFSFQKIICLN